MEDMGEIRFRRDDLRALVTALLERAGAAADAAESVSRAVVDASERGFDTHGIRLVPHYLRTLVAGRINPTPAIRFTRLAPAAGHVDADDGFGHLASFRAIEEGVALARETGIAAVAVSRSSHHGATGCYTYAAALQGFAAIGMTNTDAIVVPHGGVGPFYGTNPLSFALPVAGEAPLLLDMATSSIPWNRVLLRRATGTPLPPDVAVDAAGDMTTEPQQAVGLLPLGGVDYGYKGAGLAAMVDLLCSAFTGMTHGFTLPSFAQADLSQKAPLGHFFILLRPELFQPLAIFDHRVAAFLADLRAQPARPGQRVMAPGDPERPIAEDREANGIPVDEATWHALKAFCLHYGCTAPAPLGSSAAGPN